MNNPLLARFDGEPALVNPETQGRFAALLNGVMAHELAPVVMATEFASDDEYWTELGEYSRRLRPYSVRNGVLQIPVKGVLLKGFPYQFFDMATGYEYIRMAFDRGMADPEVKGIAFAFDTPGGMVAGNFDLVDHIYENRGKKPIAGFADEHAYSAGYSLISAVDVGRITVGRTGGVGSIGVVTAHVDVSAAMDRMGVKVTFIHAGKYKVEGNPYEALSDEAKARIQTRIDSLYDLFTRTVARNRGMDEKAIRDTEALTFSASEAVSNGLADSIGSLDDAIAAFAADLSKKEDDTMSTKDTSAVDQAAVETARTEGHAAGVKEGAAAERARFSAIVNSDAAKARPKTAMKYAANDKLSMLDADTIVEMLADLPEEKAEAAPAPKANEAKGKDGAAADFVAAMDGAEHPEAGSPAAKTEEQAKADRRRAALAASGRLAVVQK
jgi:signal peptide peptidase SppA